MTKAPQTAVVAYAVYFLIGLGLLAFISYQLAERFSPSRDETPERRRSWQPPPSFAPFPYDPRGSDPVFAMDELVVVGDKEVSVPTVRLLGNRLLIRKKDSAGSSLAYESAFISRPELESWLSRLLDFPRREDDTSANTGMARLIDREGKPHVILADTEELHRLLDARFGLEEWQQRDVSGYVLTAESFPEAALGENESVAAWPIRELNLERIAAEEKGYLVDDARRIDVVRDALELTGRFRDARGLWSVRVRCLPTRWDMPSP